MTALPPEKSNGVLPCRKRLFLRSSYKITKFFDALPDSAPRQSGKQLKKKKKIRKREKEGGMSDPQRGVTWTSS